METSRIRIFELLLIMIIAFLPNILEALFLLIFGFIDYSRYANTNQIPSLIQIAFSIGFLFYMIISTGKEYQIVESKFADRIKEDLHSLLILFVVIIITGMIIGLLYSGVEQPENLNSLFTSNLVNNVEFSAHPLFLVFFFFRPIQEELIVKGFATSEYVVFGANKTVSIIVILVLHILLYIYLGFESLFLFIPFIIVFPLIFFKTKNMHPIIHSNIIINLFNLLN